MPSKKVDTDLARREQRGNLEILRAHMLGNHKHEELTAKQQELFHLYKETYALTHEYSKGQIAKILYQKGLTNNVSYGYHVYNQAIELFASPFETTDGLRNVLTEMLMRLHGNAVIAKDYRSALGAIKEIANLQGLNKETSAIDYDQLQIAEFIFTTDVSAIPGNTIDISPDESE